MSKNVSPPDKKALREEFLKIRKGLSGTAARSAAKAAAANVLAYVRLPEAQTIGFYYPIHNELDALLLLEKLGAMGHTTALPVAVNAREPLLFRQWKQGEELVKGRIFNVMEPPASAATVVPNVLVVPMLAFNKAGYRLGYGSGMYDRTIADLRVRVPGVKVIGYAFDNQYSTVFRAEKHDQRVDFIITEKKVLSF